MTITLPALKRECQSVKSIVEAKICLVSFMNVLNFLITALQPLREKNLTYVQPA